MSLTKSFFALFSILFVGCAAETADTQADAAPSEAAESEQTKDGRVGRHGMVLVGSPDAAFLSHIPMFQTPHDVQMIVAGKLVSPTPLPASFASSTFTFLPDLASLDALRNGRLAELRGTVFAGNFEQGGRAVANGVRFVFERVVHQHVLDRNEKQPELTYLVFGTAKETYAVHRIAGAPSFDEILRVELTKPIAEDVLKKGVVVPLPKTPDTLAARRDENAAFVTKATLSCLVGEDFVAPCD